MILNRQFIKILEDLRIAPGVFMDLQRIAVDKLRFMTASAINTSSFLEEVECPRATQMPSLVRQLGQIGLDYHQDSFLYSVVEIAVVTKLRDIKYRGRIPVDSGCTLYGIMDESGYLREGEIYVVTEKSPEGGRQVLVMDPVVITRSPAMHPGDVQIVNAVDVPPDNPLRRLSNVVVFSQHGARDLPSQLSGGDLDGDIFNVSLPTSIYVGQILTSTGNLGPSACSSRVPRSCGLSKSVRRGARSACHVQRHERLSGHVHGIRPAWHVSALLVKVIARANGE